MKYVEARRVVAADKRGSSWPVLVETDDGRRFTKLRGAGQGTGPLVAEVIAAAIAEAIGLRVPERSLVCIGPAVESLDRRDELRDLLDASVGVNLGFTFLDGGRLLLPSEIDRVNADDAAAIVWLDRLVMNPDRTLRNTNLMWWHNQLWLIDHGAALGFQYAWSGVTESAPLQPMTVAEPHLLTNRAADLVGWDEILAARLPRETIAEIVDLVPDQFLAPLLPEADRESPGALHRRRAAYAAFLWKRLKPPRGWMDAEVLAPSRSRRVRPSWTNR